VLTRLELYLCLAECRSANLLFFNVLGRDCVWLSAELYRYFPLIHTSNLTVQCAASVPPLSVGAVSFSTLSAGAVSFSPLFVRAASLFPLSVGAVSGGAVPGVTVAAGSGAGGFGGEGGYSSGTTPGRNTYQVRVQEHEGEIKYMISGDDVRNFFTLSV